MPRNEQESRIGLDKQDIDLIERVQRRFTKRLPGYIPTMKDSPY